MHNATYCTPDLTTFCGLDELGLTATGQHLTETRAVIECKVIHDDAYCHRCGAPGTPRDTRIRRLSHAPFGWRPTVLAIRVRRDRWATCKHVWVQDMRLAAEPKAKISRGGLRWALKGIVCQHLSMARVAESLAVSWNTANHAVLAEGQRVLISSPSRFDKVSVIGVDEHVWRHARYGDNYVTVIIDLTPVQQRTGPARLLDMVQGRSKQVFKSWLQDRDPAWRAGVQIVAMDGFTGFKTAAAEELPHVVEMMDPFHVVKLAGTAVEKARQPIQHGTLGRRGRTKDPLYRAGKSVLIGEDLLSERGKGQLQALFAAPGHRVVEATWKVYQRLVAAYRAPSPREGKERLRDLIHDLTKTLPDDLVEVKSLATTLKKRATDILAYFDHLGSSNGPTEAINGGWSIFVGRRWGSGTSGTMSRGPCWSLVGSDWCCTLNCEEPV